MGFNDDLASSLGDIFLTAGIPAVLTRGVVDTTCHIDLIRGIDLQPDEFATQVSGDSIVIELLLSEIGAEPARGDTITVVSTVYTVESIAENDGYTVKAIVK